MLKKVVVFDSGMGGGVIGDLIEDELPVEVVRVNDLKNAPYGERSEGEIRDLTEKAISPYIGEADVIVLAEPEVALSAEEFLQRKYPDQPFVGYGLELPRLLRREKRVRILTTAAVQRTAKYQEMKADCTETKITERECSGWVKEFARYGEIDRATEDEMINDALAGFKNGLIILYATDMIRVKERIRKRFKWRANVVDMRGLLLRDTCVALKYPGKDGRRMRELIW